jgi:hypothetical protein
MIEPVSKLVAGSTKLLNFKLQRGQASFHRRPVATGKIEPPKVRTPSKDCSLSIDAEFQEWRLAGLMQWTAILPSAVAP